MTGNSRKKALVMVICSYRVRASSDERSRIHWGKGVTGKDAFYETEKARGQTGDMHMYIQTVLESRNLPTAGNWSRLTRSRQGRNRAFPSGKRKRDQAGN